MPLPPRSYYHIDELSEAWGSSVPELASFVMDDLLQICVMALCVHVEIGNYEENEHGYDRMPIDYKTLSGLQPVYRKELWPVFQNGSAEISSFRPGGGADYVSFRDDQPPMRITLKDLLISATDRLNFENKYGLGKESERSTGEEPAVFTHNDSYTAVCIQGVPFKLGLCQAAVVRQLHQASRTEQVWVDGKTLLREAGADSRRLVDLFKNKDWRKLIASEANGRYRLRLPTHPTPEANDRVYRRFRWTFSTAKTLQSL
jgi:hypothetical protein